MCACDASLFLSGALLGFALTGFLLALALSILPTERALSRDDEG